MRKELLLCYEEVAKQVAVSNPSFVVVTGAPGSGKSLVGYVAHLLWCRSAVLSLLQVNMSYSAALLVQP